jgi:hypothetical protein
MRDADDYGHLLIRKGQGFNLNSPPSPITLSPPTLLSGNAPLRTWGRRHVLGYSV